MNDRRPDNQLRLTFAEEPAGEAQPFAAQEAESSTAAGETERPVKSVIHDRTHNQLNGRVRTRMHGGVGGAGPQGPPLSRSTTRVVGLRAAIFRTPSPFPPPTAAGTGRGYWGSRRSQGFALGYFRCAPTSVIPEFLPFSRAFYAAASCVSVALRAAVIAAMTLVPCAVSR